PTRRASDLHPRGEGRPPTARRWPAGWGHPARSFRHRGKLPLTVSRHLPPGGCQGPRTRSGAVVEFHAPAPLALVLGVPPRLEDPRLTPGEDHQAPPVGLGGPAVLQRDLRSLAHEKRHRALLVALELHAAGDN